MPQIDNEPAPLHQLVAQDDRPLMCFKFNGPGRHIQDDPNAPIDKRTGRRIKIDKAYDPGAEVWSVTDLATRFNTDSHKKFERLLDKEKSRPKSVKPTGDQASSPPAGRALVSTEELQKLYAADEPPPSSPPVVEEPVVRQENEDEDADSNLEDGSEEGEAEEVEKVKLPNFDYMNIDDIRSWAKAEGLDTRRFKTKREIIAFIKRSKGVS